MVLGRRFKLYFILCVWDRMAATGNSNTNNSNTNIENYGNVVTTHSERDNNAKFLESILKSLFTYKSLIHPQYIKNTDREWYNTISNHIEDNIKFLKLFQMKINEIRNINFPNNTLKYQAAFDLAKTAYEESTNQPTPGGARRGNKKQQKHRTRRNKKQRKHRTRKH